MSSMYLQLLFLRRATVNFPVETRDVSPFVPRSILQLGGDDLPHVSPSAVIVSGEVVMSDSGYEFVESQTFSLSRKREAPFFESNKK